MNPGFTRSCARDARSGEPAAAPGDRLECGYADTESRRSLLRLRGPNHDGHSFVASATARGAAGVVVERTTGAPMNWW